ncbi:MULTISPECIES: apolipoprotein N-acyltransferase [Gammaproteobacteria]|uniref:apolipoprotein N-acyltransferase n=1 Tax=Gammaproteobacteria TaxID=1236 RepID=UPI000DCFCEDD|nr:MULTISPECIES: apolipoprotein N-acyltransferase [Gammaproteobacteria]RTE87449.1 apolipoprotein N-acyltransferase [Aliidiomarina sp. B3213]TCZ92766.1 apolipoprotein N-acyltransferase [Lysobacter sp. N42]
MKLNLLLNKHFWLSFWRYPSGRCIAAALLGGTTVFSYAPFSLHLSMPVLLTGLLLVLVRSTTAKQALLVGFSFGLGWFGAGVSWVYVSIDQFGGLPLLFSVLLMVLLCGYLALYPAIAAWSWHKFRIRSGSYALWTFPLFWLFSEWLRSWLLTGFPWLGLGYTQTSSTLGNLAPHMGEIGITVVLWLIAIAFCEILLKRKLEYLAIPVLLFAIAWFSPNFNPMQPTGETRTVALVQGNIQQSLKWDESQQWPNYLTYQDLSRPLYASSDIVFWPESAVTFIEPYAQQPLNELDHRVRTQSTEVVTGIINYNRETREYFNSIITLGSESQPYQYMGENRYEKHHLLPIGEFVPFQTLLSKLGPLFNLPMSSFSRGDTEQNNLNVANTNIAANICYEVVFSDYIRQQVNSDTDILLTISNDSWFGRSHGPHQHFQIAQMRAKELGRPMLRVTNNGVTGVIDDNGNIAARIAQFAPGVLQETIVLVEGETLYQKWGDSIAWLISLLLSAIVLIRKAYKKR